MEGLPLTLNPKPQGRRGFRQFKNWGTEFRIYRVWTISGLDLDFDQGLGFRVWVFGSAV